MMKIYAAIGAFGGSLIGWRWMHTYPAMFCGAMGGVLLAYYVMYDAR